MSLKIKLLIRAVSGHSQIPYEDFLTWFILTMRRIRNKKWSTLTKAFAPGR